jgi:ABC-type Zn2+ transport system substrate-binding protein/surface adhesin
MIADLVRNVGGDRVEVTALMGPGVDPHLYKPSASDVDLLNDADIIFYGGLHLEGRMVETFEAIDLLLVHLLTHEGQRASKPESTLGHVSAALRWSHRKHQP